MISTANSVYNASLYQSINKNKTTATSNASYKESVTTSNYSKNLSFATSKTTDSSPLFAVLSFTGNSFSVYKSNDYTEENPTYLVAGKEKGKDFEVAINAIDVKPNQASIIEMAALQAHLKEKGIINNIELHPYKVDQSNYPVERSLFEKMNVMSVYNEMYKRNLTNPRFDHIINLGKIMYALDSINSNK